MNKDEKKSEDDLRLFKAHVLYWDDKLGLKRFVKRFESAYQPEAASVAGNYQERFAMFTLGEDRSDNFTIPELARHEALELLMDDLEQVARQYFSEDYIRRMVHDIIHALENVIPLPKDLVKK